MPIHPTAVVHPSVEVHDSNDIGPGVIIDESVTLGRDNRISAHVYLGPGTTIGDENHIHFSAVIGHEPQDLAFSGEPTFTRVGNRNRIREHVTIHRGTKPGSETVIGDDNFLMVGCHLAHNCRLADSVIIANHSVLGGHVQVDDRVFIPAHSAIHQFARIGRLSFLSGLSGLSQDLPPFFMAAGRQATALGLNTVGLRRAGLTPETRTGLKDAHATLYRPGLTIPEATARLQESTIDEVRELAESIAASDRGIVSRADEKP